VISPAADPVSSAAAAQPKRRTGLLTMDASRRVVPLRDHGTGCGDPGCPVIGAWVAGADGPSDPLVYAACMRFMYARGIVDRAMQGSAFLVMIYPRDPAAPPAFYAARAEAPEAPFAHVRVVRNAGVGRSLSADGGVLAVVCIVFFCLQKVRTQ
jgi:hypothetical protein